MMKDHIYKQGKTKTDENTWFTKYAKIVGTGGCTICIRLPVTAGNTRTGTRG